MTKSIVLALAAAGTLLCSASANAGGHVSWSVGISAPPIGVAVGSGPVYGYPVYESYPVYAPAPVYVQPAPVYYQPAPVYYGPPAYYYRHHHHHGYRPQVAVYPPAPYPRHWR
jgi:hypothetical protein